MMTMGFNCRGTEEVFEKMLRKAIAERSTHGFRAVEIGVAEGVTTRAMAELVRHEMNHVDYQIVGIDVVDGAFFNAKQFLLSTLSFNTSIEFFGKGGAQAQSRHDIRILLMKGEERSWFAPDQVNFALIDGCHGAPCVEKDFLSIEEGMAKGGIVAFHDAGEADQGIHFQPHCQMNISVLQALNNLGLEQVRRPGWQYLGRVDGDKSPGNLADNGHGFMFFQKI